MMNLFPEFPLHLSPLSLLGMVLLLGLVGGELAKRTRFLPAITGYIAIGFLVGPDALNIVSHSWIVNSHHFIDISLSLILFTLGNYLDFKWLRRDYSLFFMSIAESALTFVLIFFALIFIAGLSKILSALASAVAIATSPAVIMMVSHDLSSEGPVTRRVLILTSLNNFFALTLFLFLLPMVDQDLSLSASLAHFLYNFLGSILLGIFLFCGTKIIAGFIGKNKTNQLILLSSILVLANGLAQAFHFSSLLTLFVLGVFVRNFDQKHILIDINFGWLSRLFYILLFVMLGLQIKLAGLWQSTDVVVLFIFLRIIAKAMGVWLFSKASRLTVKQTFAIHTALLPMAGVAIGMSNMLINFAPDFGQKLIVIIAAVVALFNVIGPILTQQAFIMTNETELNKA